MSRRAFKKDAVFSSSSKANGKANDNANVTPRERELLGLIQSTNALGELAEITGRKKPSVHRNLSNLVKKELAENRHGLYFITTYGHEVLKGERYPSLRTPWERLTPVGGEQPEKVRLHKVSFTITFWVIPPGWDKIRGRLTEIQETEELPIVEVKNNPKFRGGGKQTIIFRDYTVMCYAPSIQVNMPEVIDTPEEAVKRSWRDLRRLLPKLERLLGIPTQSLWSNRRLNVRVSSMHMALFDSIWADFMVNEKGCRRYLVRDSFGDGRILIDASQGDGEKEAIDPYHLMGDIEFMQELERQLRFREGYMPRETKEALDMINAQIVDINNAVGDFQTQLLPTMEFFADQIQAHTETATANLTAARALNEAIAELRRIVDWVLWPFQLIRKLLS